MTKEILCKSDKWIFRKTISQVVSSHVMTYSKCHHGYDSKDIYSIVKYSYANHIILYYNTPEEDETVGIEIEPETLIKYSIPIKSIEKPNDIDTAKSIDALYYLGSMYTLLDTLLY